MSDYTVIWSDTLHAAYGGFRVEAREHLSSTCVVTLDGVVVHTRAGTDADLGCVDYAAGIVSDPERAARLYRLHTPKTEAA